MSATEVIAIFSPSPEQLAAAFWAMGSDEQAQFFAALDCMAGVKLCFQMAGVVDEIRKLADAGKYEAMDGFQTMLSHAQSYHESAAQLRAWDSVRELNTMAEQAKERIA